MNSPGSQPPKSPAHLTTCEAKENYTGRDRGSLHGFPQRILEVVPCLPVPVREVLVPADACPNPTSDAVRSST